MVAAFQRVSPSRMDVIRRIAAAIAAVALAAPAAAQAPVQERTYPITGGTGLELYRSIAEKAPNGGGHVAQTSFKLTWKRLFDERGGDCFLVHAKPVLSITQTFPKPGKLDDDMRRRWEKFAAGMRQHEDQHVRMIEEMVKTTEASLVGMSVKDDRTCAKVKRAVSARIDEGYQAHRQRSRAFDKAEMGFGGRMFVMLEDLVNER